MRAVHGTETIVAGIMIRLQAGTYPRSRQNYVTAVCCDTGKSYGRLTVAMDREALGTMADDRGLLFVKTWSENAGFAEAMLKTGLFEDTHSRLPTGHVHVHVWRLAEGVTWR